MVNITEPESETQSLASELAKVERDLRSERAMRFRAEHELIRARKRIEELEARQ